jgi:hypothetical protein
MSAAIIGLIGVILGFCLSAGYEEWKTWRNRKEMKTGLLEELRANLYMIPQKRDILQKIISQLSEGRLLPGASVRFLQVFYETHLPSIFHHLDIQERNSLHVLYEYFRIIDWLLETYADRIVEAMGTEKVNDCIRLYSAMMSDALDTLNLAEKLIKKHLDGKPEDVLLTAEKEYIKVINAKYTGDK